MSDSFLKLCSLAKIEVDNVINSINLDHKTGSDFLSQKNAASPVVTKIDLEIEKQLRKLIEVQYPNAGILGEEYSEKLAHKESKYRFILDPIDGTIALVTGKPTYTTLMALEVCGEFHSGWVYLPALKQEYQAIKGYGAYGPTGLLKTSDKKTWESIVWSSTTPSMFPDNWQKKLLSYLDERCWLSSFGGDAMQYCLLAQGRIDMVIENQMEIHDYAAVAPIVKEAGGCISDFDGNSLDSSHSGQVLATANSTLHAMALELIQEVRNKLY